jgi:hypothetical protein
MNTKNDESSVIFRRKNPFSSNRNQMLPYISQDNLHINHSYSLNPSDTTLFYVTSSIFDDNSKSYSSSDQPSLSVNNFSMTSFFFFFHRKENVCLNMIETKEREKKVCSGISFFFAA